MYSFIILRALDDQIDPSYRKMKSVQIDDFGPDIEQLNGEKFSCLGGNNSNIISQ